VTRAGFGKVEISTSAIGAELMGYADRDDAACWPHGVDAPIAAAVAQACERLTPARVGAGWGSLAGHTVNGRRLEDPVDRAVLVRRVDDTAGAPLGLYYGFACHPVVLGADNREVSADRPGQAARILEQELGPVAVFGQGACADVNPLTARVRERIASAGDRDATCDTGPLGGHGVPRAAPDEPLDVMLVGLVGPGVLLLGQPGEVFAETGVDLRRELREAGVRHPFVVGCANGWRAYLAPRSAYPEGGYEVDWAVAMRHPEILQDDIRALVVGALAG
jgi:hypothetical protein